jgi:hypothetical protein
MQDLFVFERRGVDETGRVLGATVPTGIRPHFQHVFAGAGIELPISMFLRSAYWTRQSWLPAFSRGQPSFS